MDKKEREEKLHSMRKKPKKIFVTWPYSGAILNITSRWCYDGFLIYLVWGKFQVSRLWWQYITRSLRPGVNTTSENVTRKFPIFFTKVIKHGKIEAYRKPTMDRCKSVLEHFFSKIQFWHIYVWCQMAPCLCQNKFWAHSHLHINYFRQTQPWHSLLRG